MGLTDRSATASTLAVRLDGDVQRQERRSSIRLCGWPSRTVHSVAAHPRQPVVHLRPRELTVLQPFVNEHLSSLIPAQQLDPVRAL